MSKIGKQSVSCITIFMILDTPVGAYHHYVSQLCNALADRPEIAKVIVVPIFTERHLSAVSKEERELLDPRVVIDFIVPGGQSRCIRYVAFLKNLFRHLREASRSSHCVIHIQTATGMQLLDISLLGIYRILGIPIVRTIHELTATERIKVPNSFEKWLGKLQIKQADAIVVHDVHTQRDVTALIKKDIPIFTIPHGHYWMFRKFVASEKDIGIPFNNPPVALFLGFKRHKGIEIFLQALQQLGNKNFPVKAKIVGRINPGDEDLINMVKNIKNVEINPGYISNAEMWKVYSECDFVVLPYLKGTTSGAIHLAYAFKRPVITSDLSCFKDLVIHGKTGLIVPKGDSSALADAIIRICRSREERVSMGEAGFQQTCLEIYRWENIAERTVKVYMEVFKRRNGSVLSPHD